MFWSSVLNEWFEDGNVKGRLNFYIDEKLTLTESLFVDGLKKDRPPCVSFRCWDHFIFIPNGRIKSLIQQSIEAFSASYDHNVEYGLTDVDGILVLRLLGSQTEPMMACFAQVWQTVRQHWLGYCPEPPRIWAT